MGTGRRAGLLVGIAGLLVGIFVVVVVVTSQTAAAPPAITAPSIVFTAVGTPLPFAESDTVSGEDRTIEVNATTGTECDPPDTLTNCPTVRLEVGNGSMTIEPSGAVINQGDPGGGASAIFNVAGTGDQLNAALATLVYTPEDGYETTDSDAEAMNVRSINGDGSGDNFEVDVVIRVEDANDAPDVTVPAGPLSVDVDDELAITSQLSVADDDIDQGESNDVMLLVTWVDCGQIALAGGSFAVSDDIGNLLTNEAGLPQGTADAIVAALPDEVTSLNLSSSPNQSDPAEAIAGVGSLTEVNGVLSDVDFFAPSSDDTCTLNVLVSDLGNNGMPIQYVTSPPPGFDVPDPSTIVDWDSVDIVVGDGTTPSTTTSSSMPGGDTTTSSSVVDTTTSSSVVDTTTSSSILDTTTSSSILDTTTSSSVDDGTSTSSTSVDPGGSTTSTSGGSTTSTDRGGEGGVSSSSSTDSTLQPGITVPPADELPATGTGAALPVIALAILALGLVAMWATNPRAQRREQR